MPFRRRRNRRRSRRTRLSRARFRPRRRMIRRRRLTLPVERKFLDTVIQGTFPADAANVAPFLLNTAPQGIDAQSRQGFMSTAVSLFLNLTMTVTGGSAAQNYRVILVIDNSPQGVELTTQDFLENSNPVPAAIVVVQSLRNLSNTRRARVIMDRRFTTTNARNNVRLQKFMNFRIQTRYVGVGSAIINVDSGALWLFFISDQFIAGSPPAFALQARVRFVG